MAVYQCGGLMIPFTKMHGTGNDYIYVNALDRDIPEPGKLSVSMSDRHFGIGSDGLILILPSDRGDFRMRMFNSDGSESEMCGNGIRCFAKYVYDRRLTDKTVLDIETGGGMKNIVLTVKDGKATHARVDMGVPELERGKIPMNGAPGQVINEEITLPDGTKVIITAVSMGNPHAIVYVEDVDSYPVEKIGGMIENLALFPRRTNVEFVQIISKTEVIQRTWERGAGETLACGTGASAVCAAGVVTGRTGRKITSNLRGGSLSLEWADDDHMIMTGSACEVFSGVWEL